jgi:hypothetical protein
MDALSKRRWGYIRRLGKGRFIVLAALLFSACSLFFFALFIRIFDIHSSTSFETMLAFALICYGPVWSISFWTEMERRWRQPKITKWWDLS